MNKLFATFMGQRATTKTDVVLAFAGIILAAIKAVDTTNTYRKENKS